MFSQINGLPLHVLIVHAAVVAVPLAALLAILFVVPRTRAWSRLPLLIVATVAAIAVYIAKLTGGSFRHALERNNGPGWISSQIGSLVQQHAQRANVLLVIVVIFAVIVVVAFAASHRPSTFTRPIAFVVSAVLLVGAAALVVQTYRVGDIGARAVWNPTGTVNYK
ncbi:MAG: DUF2231 domain-containing protein [Nocardioidaceae bacterium]